MVKIQKEFRKYFRMKLEVQKRCMEVTKAVVCIQSVFRGYKVRRNIRGYMKEALDYKLDQLKEIRDLKMRDHIKYY